MNRFVRLIPAAVLVSGLAACSDNVSPDSVDPVALQSQMNDLASVFQNNAAFNSLVVLSSSFPRYGGTALLDAAPVHGAPTARLAALRTALRGLAGPRELASVSDIQALFPANVLGKTLEWDTQTSQYVVGSQTGAPANGIRILIYVLNAQSTGPAVPLQQLGYVELTDESTPQFDRLGVLLRLLGQTVADYAVTRVSGTSSTEVTATGRLQSVDLERYADFDMSVTGDINAAAFGLSQDITGNDGTRVVLNISGDDTGGNFEIIVAADGNELEMDVADNGTTVNGGIFYNGFQVGTISGPSDDPVIGGVGGRNLPADEVQALTGIFVGATLFALILTIGIFAPAAVVF